MDVETEVSFPCTSSPWPGACTSVAKRPRTEDDQHHKLNSANSCARFPENNTKNGLFLKTDTQPKKSVTSSSLCCRRFFIIHPSGFVYESEDFRAKGETLYTPLQVEVIVNTRNIEQFTFTNGYFFIGDESSRFIRTVEGVSLNMWRFDDEKRVLYVSRSFVFTNPQEAQDIKRILESM